MWSARLYRNAIFHSRRQAHGQNCADRGYPLYNFRSSSYWLRRLENYGRKERVPVDEYTIERVATVSAVLTVGLSTGMKYRIVT